MRTLLILRGAPGAGKSTWIKEHDLEEYTLCPDSFRLLYSSKSLNPNGDLIISQNHDSAVWNNFNTILEYRMQNGEFTVIDATTSRSADLTAYKKLADKYRYRCYIMDFADVPLETCLAQNKKRPTWKQVPEEVIREMYARFETQKVPSCMTVLKKDQFYDMFEEPINLYKYNKLVFIGDIHGCYDTLMQYPDFKNGLKEDTEYVFLGDYIDRGHQNYEVLKFLSSIKDLPNVCLLEGNHERWIRDYGRNIAAKSNEFEKHTKVQLEENGFTPSDANILCSKLRQFSHILWNGLEILACHGGIPNLNTNLLFISTHDIVKGVGQYEDYLQNTYSWMNQTRHYQYLIHGHRNTEHSQTHIADRVFNLEGRVEFGGDLRIVELTSDGWNVVNLKNVQPDCENTEERPVDSIENAIDYLRHNDNVQEKKLDENVSSFNFTRNAFEEKIWSKQTILARGLFIDTTNKKIMARSYEKFFKINETVDTQLGNLKNKLKFPVTAYLKENGFLAIVSYDYRKDDLFIASKSTNKGDYVEYIKKQLEPYKEKILNHFREMMQGIEENKEKCAKQGIDLVPHSLVFECVDMDNDPHIIKYRDSEIVLLDAILNKLDYQCASYKYLQRIAQEIGCPVKQEAYVVENWDEFLNLVNATVSKDFKFNGNYIEGFVFEDANGFMTKCKTGYYDFWKFMRGIAQSTLKYGRYAREDLIQEQEAKEFYEFCKKLYNQYSNENGLYPFKTDIISLREAFLNK